MTDGDYQGQSASPSPFFAASAEEANLKKFLLRPTELFKKYFEDITKDFRTSNIPKAEQEYYMEYILLTKENVNMAINLDFMELAFMEMSELSITLNSLVSVEGFQIKNLGTTTGYSRSENKTTTTTNEVEKNAR